MMQTPVLDYAFWDHPAEGQGQDALWIHP